MNSLLWLKMTNAYQQRLPTCSHDDACLASAAALNRCSGGIPHVSLLMACSGGIGPFTAGVTYPPCCRVVDESGVCHVQGDRDVQSTPLLGGIPVKHTISDADNVGEAHHPQRPSARCCQAVHLAVGTDLSLEGGRGSGKQGAVTEVESERHVWGFVAPVAHQSRHGRHTIMLLGHDGMHISTWDGGYDLVCSNFTR
jgi:hypothetical protein